MILNVVSVIVLVVIVGTGIVLTTISRSPVWVAIGVPLGFIAALSPRVAQQWERAIVLRLGRFTGLRGPGLFWVIPFIDAVTRSIDQRMITTGFAAEQTLTSDTVPVNVDAVLFWVVHDPEKAALEVQNYPVRSAGRPRPHCATSSAAPRSPTCCAGARRSSRSCSA